MGYAENIVSASRD